MDQPPRPSIPTSGQSPSTYRPGMLLDLIGDLNWIAYVVMTVALRGHSTTGLNPTLDVRRLGSALR